MDLMVEKRDGSKQPFSRDKITKGLIFSGLEEDQANQLTNQIEQWVQEELDNGLIRSTTIREKVLEALRQQHPEAAEAFANYQK